ncbi:Ig-like domain repeat protein [Streptomyces sp. ISL-90]|nr:Ig-like domain repeat protein [Streptomyces sp. ISL-90]
MRTKRRFTAILAAIAVLVGTLSLAPTSVMAQPPQPTSVVPPIIGNTAGGVLRDVPTKYYAAIERFENRAIQDVLETHALTDSDANAVRAWGRDAVRSQEFLNLMAIIAKPAASRTADEALVYSWFQEIIQQQEVAQNQAALDQYLEWSGLSLDTISLDPIPRIPGGGGYCDFHPPKELEEGTGAFGSVYDASLLPQCQGSTGTTPACMLGPTGCPVPWPTVEQFQQWGRYLAQEDLWENPVFPNLAMEASVGVGLAATMAATGVATAAARSYAAVPVASTSGTLFTKVFPHSARAFTTMALDGTKVTTEAAKTAARASAGVIRAGAVAFVVGTIITALVTIGLESWTIYEHQQIPITLKKALSDAQATPPDLAAMAGKESGVSALLTTFISTTQIDVDYDCQLPNDENGYSAFPCANAPAPAAATAEDDRFYVSTETAGVVSGAFQDSIYTVNPVDSDESNTLNESVRPSGDGWFVVTKYDGGLPGNQAAPTTAGATLQSLRLYYNDWSGNGKVAERVMVDGHPMFAVSSLESADLGGCAAAPAVGAASTCLTDTIRYAAPDGTLASARIVAADAAGPDIDAVVPERVIAGEPFSLSANATETFGTAPFTYTWKLLDKTYTGPSTSAVASTAGNHDVQLTVADAQGNTTTEFYPVLVAQTTTVVVKQWPTGDLPYGGSLQVWAGISPVKAQGVQCSWNQTTGELGCVSPTGAVQFYLDGRPIGDPVPVTQNYAEPCFLGGGCTWTWGENVAYGPAITLPSTGLATGSHPQVSAVYYGDEKFVGGSSAPLTLEVVKAVPAVALTSGSVYPSWDEPMTLTASVVAAPGNRGVPTGSVQFLEGTSLAPLGDPVPLDSTGAATRPGVLLKYVGSLVVRYLGDKNFAATDSASTPIRFPVATSAAVDPPSSTVLAGADVEVAITVRDEIGETMAGAHVVVSPGDVAATTDAAGVATVTVTSDAVGEISYSIAAAGIAGLGSMTVAYGTAPEAEEFSADAEAGVAFALPLSAAGTPSPAISVTGLPEGLSFDPATGEITGTPTAAGATVASITATSVLGTATAPLTLTVHPAVGITTTALPSGTATLPYEAPLAAEGGLPPFQWAAAGLPDGLTIDTETGLVSGTPTTEGAAHVTLTLTDALGGTDSIELDLGIAPQPRPDLTVAISAHRMVTGTVARYTVTVVNEGTADAASPVVVEATLGAGLKVVGVANDGWNCESERRTVSCTADGDLVMGATTTLVFDVRIGTGPGSVTSSVTVVPAEDEIETTDNGASLTSAVVARPRR